MYIIGIYDVKSIVSGGGLEAADPPSPYFSKIILCC